MTAIQLIMTYLKEQHFYKTLAALELESQSTLDNYTKELSFLRHQILEGNFMAAELFLQPLKTRLGEHYNTALLEIKKQEYFELIEQKPELESLFQILRQIEAITSIEQYKQLCFCLTLPLKEHPDYGDWGRMECFDKLANILKSLGRTFRFEKYTSLSLSQVLERYQSYQQAFNLAFEEEHDIHKESRMKIDEMTQPKQQKLAFHSRVRSGDSQQSSQFYQSQSARKKEQDINIIIEKLHVSDIVDQEEGDNMQSSLFNYRFEDMQQVGILTDPTPIRAATFSSDGELFAIGTNSKSLKVFAMKSLLEDLESEVPVLWEKQNHHQGSIYCIDWSRDGKLIGTGSNDKTVKLLNHDEGYECTLVGHKGVIRTVCFLEHQLLSAGQDCIIKVWDLETQKCIRNIEGHTQPIYCLQAGGDGSYQVSVGQDRTLRVWDQRASKAMSVLTMASEINYVSLSDSTHNHNLQVLVKGSKKAPQFSSESLAALAHQDGSVSVWNLAQQKNVKTLKYHSMDCRSVEFDPTARYLASASFDNTIAIYDWEQQKLVTQIEEHGDRVVLCKWHPFYPFVLSTSADSTARIFAPQGFLQQLIKSFHIH